MIQPEILEPRPLDMQDMRVWNLYWGDVARRIGSLFARSETRQRAMAYLAGLLSPAERKNAWQLAEINAEINPYGFQYLLGRADWDPDQLRDRLYRYVCDFLAEPDAIGVLDETGFLKKGTHSVGVARQYSGTAGRVENCQIGVFLTYASTRGQCLLDRELYLPKLWTDDPARCRAAGVPVERSFATKGELARQILERSFAAGISFQAIAGDSVYGDDRALRHWLEERKQAYVLAISSTEQLWLGHECYPLNELLARLSSSAWERISCGSGSQGERWYEWQRVQLNDPPALGWQRWLIVRRSCSDPTDISVYRAYVPVGWSLAAQVRVVGKRWTIEQSIQTGKAEVGLDQYEVRSWSGWYRHISLGLWAQAFLAVIAYEQGQQAQPKKKAVQPARVSSLAGFKASRGLG